MTPTHEDADGTRDPSPEERRTRVGELLANPEQLPDVPTSELVALLYDELKVVANGLVRKRRPGETITPTVLVNEAYSQLVRNPDAEWAGRAHFFGAAARAMRNVLADYWRAKKAGKRGGDLERTSLHTFHHPLQDNARFEVNRPGIPGGSIS